MTDTDDPSTAITPTIEPIAVPRARPLWPTWIEILLCSGYPTQIFIGQLLVLAGISPLRGDGGLSPTFVFALALTDTVLLLTLIMWLLVRRGERPWTVFLGNRPARPEIVFGMLSLPVVIGVVLVLTLSIRRFLPYLHNVPHNPLEGMLGSGASMWLFLIVVIVAGGVREELQRAFLLHRFRGDLGQPWMGVVITSMSFGMGHTLQGLDAAIITGALGAIWGAIYLTRGGALASIVSHSLFNSGELLRVFLR